MPVSVDGGLPPVSACLVSWRRPGNLEPIIRSLQELEFVKEILVWNNQPSNRIVPDSGKVQVIPSAENLACLGRFRCAERARHPFVYVQDDDVINTDMRRLYQRFLADPTRITHALSPWHYQRRERYQYGECQMAFLGWGAFFHRDWIRVLDQVPEAEQRGWLFRREADKFFSILLERTHHAIPGSLLHLNDHSTNGVALWLQAEHRSLSAQATRRALELVRKRDRIAWPVPWNVVIPCYNHGRFLREAVDSVLQNDADYVITIVDDGSTDATAEISEGICAAHAHVRYLRAASPRGTSAARNEGIAAADSTFVALLDSDDRFGPDYLYNAQRLLECGVDVANPDAILFGTRRSRWVAPEQSALPALLRHNTVHYCAGFRRTYWSQLKGFDERMFGWEDYDFWIRVAAAGARIRGIRGDHFFYRQHENSKTARVNEAEARAYLRSKHRSLYRQQRGVQDVAH